VQNGTAKYNIILTAVWRNWGFRQTSKLVLYLEVRSLIYTFGLPNPQLTPSHETLAEIRKKKPKIIKYLCFKNYIVFLYK
jgi:hypothetical protein